MSTNISLLIISSLMMGAAFFFGRARWTRLDLIDLYVIMISIFFGAYTFIDALFNNLYQFDSLVAAVSLFLVIATTSAIWLTSRFLPKEILSIFRIRYLIARYACVNEYALFFMSILILLFVFYGYYKFGILSPVAFGILSPVAPEDLARLNLSLPYWYTSSKMFLFPMLLIVFVGGVVKLLKKKERPNGCGLCCWPIRC